VGKNIKKKGHQRIPCAMERFTLRGCYLGGGVDFATSKTKIS